MNRNDATSPKVRSNTHVGLPMQDWPGHWIATFADDMHQRKDMKKARNGSTFWKTLVLVMAGCVLCGGCEQAAKDNSGNTRKPVPEGMIRVTPSELFRGDMERIGQHLTEFSGLVRFEYGGKKPFDIRLEEWVQGKLRNDHKFLGSVHGRGWKAQPFLDGEISLTLESFKCRDLDEGYEWAIFATKEGPAAGGRITSKGRFTFPEDLQEVTLGTSYEKVDQETMFPDDQEFVIWAIITNRANEDNNEETRLRAEKRFKLKDIGEKAKHADYAIVLKGYFLDVKESD